MSHEIICAWLGLPAENWPPNHFELLGLRVGEDNVQVIEEHVHERLSKVRQYQLNHPDQATEAMNRLAQAFTCLTDAPARKAYCESLTASKASAVAVAEAPPPVTDTSDPLGWLFGPWEKLGALPPPLPEPTASEPALANPVPIPAPARNGFHAGLVATSQPLDPVFESARWSNPARQGLGTKRALLFRISVTRQLLWHWKQVGKYLDKPQKRLTRIVEANDLTSHLASILELLPRFPPLLGRGGQPGYLVIALARQQLIIPTFRALKPEQRQILAQHWRDGRSLLTWHLDYLREELVNWRRRSHFGRFMRATGSAVREKPEIVLIALAVGALIMSLIATIKPHLFVANSDSSFIVGMWLAPRLFADQSIAANSPVRHRGDGGPSE